MRTKLILTSILMAATFTACSHMILKSPMVSMTESNLPSLDSVEPAGPVNSTWCKGEKTQRNDGSAPGLVDEAISKAQHEKKLDYIKNAQFTLKGGFSPCVTVTGEGLTKIASASQASPSAGNRKPAATSKKAKAPKKQ